MYKFAGSAGLFKICSKSGNPVHKIFLTNLNLNARNQLNQKYLTIQNLLAYILYLPLLAFLQSAVLSDHLKGQ